MLFTPHKYGLRIEILDITLGNLGYSKATKWVVEIHFAFNFATNSKHDNGQSLQTCTVVKN